MTKDVNSEFAIELVGVSKSFPPKVIYEGLDLQVRRGETLTVLGPSGTGKSVMLRLIIGLERPDEGRILVGGVDIVPLAEGELRDVRRKVAMLFQGAALFDSMTVAENVAYGLREHYSWDEDKIAARVTECLESVGLGGSETTSPSALSGGMKKRVALARALAPGPEVILYDEPTTGLDPANSRRINELIRSLQKTLGVTSIVITHDMSSALAVADRIALIADHKIAELVAIDLAKSAPPPALKAFFDGEEALQP